METHTGAGRFVRMRGSVQRRVRPRYSSLQRSQRGCANEGQKELRSCTKNSRQPQSGSQQVVRTTLGTLPR